MVDEYEAYYKTKLDATGEKAFLKLPSDMMGELLIKSNSDKYSDVDKEELEIITSFFQSLNTLHNSPTPEMMEFHQALALFLEIVRNR